MLKHLPMTLAAAAVGAAFVASSAAYAAELTLYGSISTGLVYTHTSGLDGAKSDKQLSMESAFFGDSNWGFTGEEDLGNGWTVGFTLESGFDSDTGAMAGADDNKLFDGQSYLRIGNDWLNLAFGGNIGGLSSAGGDFDLMADFDPMEGYIGVGGLGAFAMKDYASDNMLVAEITPMEGLKVSLMGSLGEDDGGPGWKNRTHYYGLGVLYEAGPFATAATIETLQYDRTAITKDTHAMAYTLAASYDFEVIKPSLMVQYVDKGRIVGGEFLSPDDGFDAPYNFLSIMTGVSAPIGERGSLRASVQYVKGENDRDSAEKGKATILALAYAHELSKRTQLWAGVNWSIGSDGLDKKLDANKTEFRAMDRATYNGWQAGLGLTHTF